MVSQAFKAGDVAERFANKSDFQLLNYVHAAAAVYAKIEQRVETALYDAHYTDLSAITGLILWHMAMHPPELGVLTPADIKQFGYYPGANFTYHFKKLVEDAYLDRQDSSVDKRHVEITLTDKARDAVAIVQRVLTEIETYAPANIPEINHDALPQLTRGLGAAGRFIETPMIGIPKLNGVK